MDRSTGNTDLLGMSFISPNLAKDDIQFQIGDDLDSDRLPIEISVDAPPHRNSYTNHIKYKFDQTDQGRIGTYNFVVPGLSQPLF